VKSFRFNFRSSGRSSGSHPSHAKLRSQGRGRAQPQAI
jgi:hypothetical protein